MVSLALLSTSLNFEGLIVLVLLQHELNSQFLIYGSHASYFWQHSNALRHVNLLRMELDATLKTRIK